MTNANTTAADRAEARNAKDADILPAQIADGASSRRASLRTRWHRSPWWILTAALSLFCVLILVLFIRFAGQVASITVPANPRTDAVVVLTGGTERIAHAVRLLSEGRADRLLISGVHPGTSPEQIAAKTRTDMELFECCVDLDRLALNTEGNAIETASWVKKHGFTSLLVVTSAYHLPRARAELQGALPKVDLIAYPVYSSGLDLKSWYRHPTTIQLLMREYVKYTLASLRIVAKDVTGLFWS